MRSSIDKPRIVLERCNAKNVCIFPHVCFNLNWNIVKKKQTLTSFMYRARARVMYTRDDGGAVCVAVVVLIYYYYYYSYFLPYTTIGPRSVRVQYNICV